MNQTCFIIGSVVITKFHFSSHKLDFVVIVNLFNCECTCSTLIIDTKDKYLPICFLASFRPVLRSRIVCLGDVIKHHNSRNIVVVNEPPKITDCMGQWHLGDDEIPTFRLFEKDISRIDYYRRFKKESAKTALM